MNKTTQSHPARLEINTKSQPPTGRIVVTTKTSGSITLRYAPKQPKQNQFEIDELVLAC